MPAAKIKQYIDIESADIIDDRSLSIPQFCEAEGFGSGAYYKLKHLGLGPEELPIPGTNLIRITPEARRAWRKRMAEMAREQAAELEAQAQQRSARASRAGKLAAQSPLHVSKRGRVEAKR
jgi:Sec-independent protein translocase protein TatA